MRIFSSVEPKVNLVSHFCTLQDFRYTDLWNTLAKLVGEIDICAGELFCMKFNSEQLLFEAFFDVLRIVGITEPQSESNFPFLYIIRFQMYSSLEPSSSTLGEICIRRLFCTKFNSDQLLFEAFSDVMRIFGSIEPQSESNFPFLYVITF